MSAEEKVGSGMPAGQARREARLAIGGVEQVKQAVRDRSTGVFLDTLMRDLRYALRTLRRNFGFDTGQHRRITLFQRQLQERVREIPGVKSAAFTAYLPLSGTNNSWAFDIEGRPANPPGVYDITNYRPVSAGYFETVGIPVLQGRGFLPADTEDAPLFVLINHSMARTWWGQQDPIGQRVKFGDERWRVIVGVVGDVHHEALAAQVEPEMYVPYGQVPNVEARPNIVLRSSFDPAGVTSAV